MSDKIEHSWTDRPVCPHCGYTNNGWWAETSLREDGDFETVECLDCGKAYKQTVSISYSFTTK